MEDSIEVNGEGKLSLAYPLKPEAREMRSNEKQIMKIQEATERKLAKDGTKRAYDEEMKKALEAGAAVKVTEGDKKEWKGGVHYIPHFPVYKQASASTKVRIVSNSKMINWNTWLSFNDLVGDVPNALSNLLNCLLRWRTKPVSLVYDLRKAYQSIFTDIESNHLRRFLHRFEGEREWTTYMYVVATFGDKPAALALELSKKVTAEIIKSYLLDHFKCLCTSLSSSMRAGSSSSGALLSAFSGSLDSSTCSSTFSCFVRRAISCDFNPLELRERQSSSLRRSFTYIKGK